MDKLSALNMFVVTAELGSFSRAAEQLGKTPSALTKAVGHLEDELGARLFERSTRRLVLTEAGLLYLDTARQVLASLREAGEEIGQLQHSLHGTLRLTAPLALGPAFFNEACAAFMAEHPQLKLQINLSDAYVDLLEAGIDLALREGRGDVPGMIVKPLAASRIVLCASPEYLQRCGTPQSADDLLSHQTLIYEHVALDRRWRLSREEQAWAWASRFHAPSLRTTAAFTLRMTVARMQAAIERIARSRKGTACSPSSSLGTSCGSSGSA